MIARALGIILLASALGNGWLWWQLESARKDLQQVLHDQIYAALEYAENARRIEAQWTDEVRRVQQQREKEQIAHRRAADRLRTERDGLRDQIAAYATGPADDTAAACGVRAATLGTLLDDALRTAAACAAGAEQHASDVRAMRDAWPK